MTKEEALWCFPQGESEPYGHVPVNRIYEAMDRYAKQEAIEFTNWQIVNEIKCYSFENDIWFNNITDERFTLNELYEKFIQSKETNNG